MLSVLIPIYNFDVNQLVSDLLHQCQNENIEFEILCIDDCSSLDFKQKNIGLKKLQNINYTELKNNIGRAKIRELLAKNAQYSNLLFLDCDVEIPDNSFIANYLKNKDYNVVIGGIAYHEKPPSNKEFTLRWLYGSQREQLSVEKRKSAKFIHFLASNLWINRDIFLAIPIQINLHGYGHEDTWIGLQLFERNIKIEQIENPVFHVGLDTSERSSYYINLLRKGVFNSYSLRYLDVEREDLLATYSDKYSFQKGYEVNDEKLEAFLAYGEKEKVERNNDDLKKSKRQITNLLKAYIARGLYNSGAYVQIINEVDPTVLKAVEVINDNTFNKLAVQYK